MVLSKAQLDVRFAVLEELLNDCRFEGKSHELWELWNNKDDIIDAYVIYMKLLDKKKSAENTLKYINQILEMKI